MIDVFIFSGQSNMSGGPPMGTLKGSGLVSNPGSPGPAPDYVPDYQKTAGNEWTGASPASIDSGVQYPYPTLANSPCLYNENIRGSTGVFDSWGNYAKQSPQFNLGGGLGDCGSYGPELSFLARYHAANPGVSIAAIKQSLGGTSLSSDWMPQQGATPEKGQFTVLRTMIEQATVRLNTAGLAWRWAGFIWMQGESGAHAAVTSSTAYVDQSRIFYTAVRALTRSDLPIAIGRIGDNWLGTSSHGWTAIDYSITSGGLTVTQTLRDSYNAGAIKRRGEQVLLGSDPNNTWWDNDGYGVRPTIVDASGYHWDGPGNLAAGERAHAAFAALTAPPTGRLRLRTANGRLKLRVGGM